MKESVMLVFFVSLFISVRGQCPDDMIWNDCGSPCESTCDNPFPICAAVCRPKCECRDANPILYNRQCIALEKCPRSECPVVKCVENCDAGYALDQNGCKTCNCPEEPSFGELGDRPDFQKCPEIECIEHCPNGYKTDPIDGCDTCFCMEYNLQLDDPCEDVDCVSGKVCKVYRLTSSGHRLSRCVDPSSPAPCQFPLDNGPCRAGKPYWYYDTASKLCFQFEYGGCKGNWNRFDTKAECEDQCLADPPIICPVLKCDLKCNHNLAIDDKGCYICECGDVDGKPIEEPENKCPDPALTCFIECARGYKKDENGCRMCECVAEYACEPLSCTMECPYGFMLDDYECQVCYCAEDPCNFKECGDGEACVAQEVKRNHWTATCEEAESSRVWCEAGPMCYIFCDHGFTQDALGCDTCGCREGPQACNMNECPDTCPFGYKYNKDGCRSCDCLPNPCNLKGCGSDMACEHKKTQGCDFCPHKTKCIDGYQAQRVSVNMNFGHGIMDDEEFNKDEFIQEFERRASKIMGVDDEYIRDVKVTQQGNGLVEVRFHVVTFGEIDVVRAYNAFADKVANHVPDTAVPIAGVDFIPKHESLTAEYSSKATYSDDSNDEGEDEVDSDVSMMMIIIACTCGGAVFIVVLVIVTITLKKAKVKKSKPVNRAIYKKAPLSDPAAADTGEKTTV